MKNARSATSIQNRLLPLAVIRVFIALSRIHLETRSVFSESLSSPRPIGDASASSAMR